MLDQAAVKKSVNSVWLSPLQIIAADSVNPTLADQMRHNYKPLHLSAMRIRLATRSDLDRIVDISINAFRESKTEKAQYPMMNTDPVKYRAAKKKLLGQLLESQTRIFHVLEANRRVIAYCCWRYRSPENAASMVEGVRAMYPPSKCPGPPFRWGFLSVNAEKTLVVHSTQHTP